MTALLLTLALAGCAQDPAPDAVRDTQAQGAEGARAPAGPRAPDPRRISDPNFANDADAAPVRPHDIEHVVGDGDRPFKQVVVFPEGDRKDGAAPAADTWAGKDGYQMVWVPGGRFRMASPTPEWLHEGDRQLGEWQPDPEREERLYDAELSRGYWVGRTEVTQALYESVMGENPSRTENLRWIAADHDDSEEVRPCGSIDGHDLVADDLPVMCITWIEAAEFANALSLRDGLEPAYVIEPAGVTWTWDSNGYRLPTEAEWEHAARGGQELKYAGTHDTAEICKYANLSDKATTRVWSDWEAFDCDDGFPTLAPVASKLPNGYGLHDMTGNVFEWTWDVHRLDHDPDATVDAINSTGSVDQIRHGGGWTTGRPLFARVSRRCASHSLNRDFGLGIRLVRFL